MPRRTIATPIGPLTIESAAGVLSAIRIGGDEAASDADSLLDEAARQLEEYFRGERRSFDLPLAAAGTPRGAALRDAIAGIAHGETISYGALARTIGSAPRAIGQACRRNPFPIVVPCHRVTSAAGPEHYSAGSGVETKRHLLALERRICCDG